MTNGIRKVRNGVDISSWTQCFRIQPRRLVYNLFLAAGIAVHGAHPLGFKSKVYRDPVSSGKR